MHRLHQNRRRHVHTHTHSWNGGFQLLYDSSTMAVVGMIRDLAHTDSLWLANNLQEQIGQMNEEKITSKRQNKSSLSPLAQCCVASTCPGACGAPAGPRGVGEGISGARAITRAGSPYCSPLSLCTGKSLCPTAPARAPLYSPSWAPEERAYQKHSFYRSLDGSAHILLCCRP